MASTFRSVGQRGLLPVDGSRAVDLASRRVATVLGGASRHGRGLPVTAVADDRFAFAKDHTLGRMTIRSSGARVTATGARITSSRTRVASATAITATQVGGGEQWSAASTGVTGGSATVAFVSPNALDAGEDGSALAARLAVVVAARVTRVVAIGGFVDPRVDVQFAASVAGITADAAVATDSRTTGAACVPHGTDTSGRHQQTDQRQHDSIGGFHRDDPCLEQVGGQMNDAFDLNESPCFVIGTLAGKLHPN